MATAIARIVVQATAQDKKAIAAKARRLNLPVSELMRRGAFAYEPEEEGQDLAMLAELAAAAADRAGAAIDDALEYIAASNERIEAVESQAARRRSEPR
jgi:hypothetical protein